MNSCCQVGCTPVYTAYLLNKEQKVRLLLNYRAMLYERSKSTSHFFCITQSHEAVNREIPRDHENAGRIYRRRGFPIIEDKSLSGIRSFFESPSGTPEGRGIDGSSEFYMLLDKVQIKATNEFEILSCELQYKLWELLGGKRWKIQEGQVRNIHGARYLVRPSSVLPII